ncbi:MAG: RidA family protein [Myxococcales bacterium]|nr:RidA family protein [Myxococcales bacterium]
MDRERHFSASPYEGQFGFARAVRVGDRILVSGTAPIGPTGHAAAPGNAYAQTWRCLQVVEEALEALGGRLEDVVRTRIYLIDREDWSAVARAHGEVFAMIRPAATAVVVAGLLDPEWRVEIEAEAVIAPRDVGI